jgi:hypothetical protein
LASESSSPTSARTTVLLHTDALFGFRHMHVEEVSMLAYMYWLHSFAERL